MPKVVSKCVSCQKEFESYPSLNRRTCSKSCATRERHKETRIGQWGRKPKRGVEVECEVCKKSIYCPPALIGKKRFCSQDCLNATKVKSPTIKSCIWCGKRIELVPSQSHRNYCSKACQGEGTMKRPLDRIHNGRRARLNDGGYIMLWEPDHPNKSLKGWQAEHRLVVEAMIGRYLESEEIIHHKNGVKTDNSPENLEITNASDHAVITNGEWLGRWKSDRAKIEEYERRFGPLE